MGGASRAQWIVLILAAGAVFAIALGGATSDAVREPDAFDRELEQANREARRERWQGRSKPDKDTHAAPAPVAEPVTAVPEPPPAVAPQENLVTAAPTEPVAAVEAAPAEATPAEPTTEAAESEAQLVSIEPVLVKTEPAQPAAPEAEPVDAPQTPAGETQPNVKFVVEPPQTTETEAPTPATTSPVPREPVATSGPPTPEAEPDIRTAAEDDGSKIAKGDARLDGRIRQPNGAVVAGIEVSLRPLRGKEVVATAFTDDNGDYAFPSVPSGRYRLDLGPAASPIAWAPDRLRLDIGTNRYDLRSPPLASLTVRVENEEEVAVSDALVLVTEVYGRRWKGRTGYDGVAKFRNLPADDYRVMVMHEKRRIDEVRQVLFANASPEVTLTLPTEPPPSPLEIARREEKEYEAAKREQRRQNQGDAKKNAGGKKKDKQPPAEEPAPETPDAKN